MEKHPFEFLTKNKIPATFKDRVMKKIIETPLKIGFIGLGYCLYLVARIWWSEEQLRQKKPD